MTSEKMDDLKIVEMVLSGDTDAFKVLVERYSPGAKFYFWSKCGKKMDIAQDLVQEAFLRAFRSLRTLLPGSSFKKWFRTICYNLSIDFSRKNKTASQLPIPSAPQIEEQIFKKEIVQEALEKLPARQREAIELKYFWDCTIEEISSILETPLGTVKTDLAQARRRLMEILEKKGGEK